MPDTWEVSSEVLTGDVRIRTGLRLGRNEYGLWLYLPAGSPVHNAEGRQVDILRAQAELIPDDKSWVASWCEDGSTTVNVTARPPEVIGRTIRCVDLELRIRVEGNAGTPQQESAAFDSAAEDRTLPVEQIAAARATFSDLQRQLAEGVEPFGRVGRRWFTGITRNELHFVAYDPEWPVKFAAVRDEILPLLPPGSRVEHFGSTSVPGLAAKDCLDIAAVVPRPEQVNQAIDALRPQGYEPRPNAFNDPGHVFCRRLTGGQRSQHLHVYHEGHQNLFEALAFRDLLRTDAQARQRYLEVKRSLARANPYDRSGYLAGKSEVVTELLQLALTGRRYNPDSLES